MKERELTNIFNNDGKAIGEALGRYAALLDYYGIEEKVKEKVWPQIINDLSATPRETIQRIDEWWREIFDPNGNEAATAQKRPKKQAGLAQLSKPQKAIYENQRECWRSSLAAKKSGRHKDRENHKHRKRR